MASACCAVRVAFRVAFRVAVSAARRARARSAQGGPAAGARACAGQRATVAGARARRARQPRTPCRSCWRVLAMARERTPRRCGGQPPRHGALLHAGCCGALGQGRTAQAGPHHLLEVAVVVVVLPGREHVPQHRLHLLIRAVPGPPQRPLTLRPAAVPRAPARRTTCLRPAILVRAVRSHARHRLPHHATRRHGTRRGAPVACASSRDPATPRAGTLSGLVGSSSTARLDYLPESHSARARGRHTSSSHTCATWRSRARR